MERGALYRLERAPRAAPEGESPRAVRRREARRVLRAAGEGPPWAAPSRGPIYLKINSTTKNETQGISDTQMMDAADGAEAVLQMVNNKGMTQQFDTSFHVKVAKKHIVDTDMTRRDKFVLTEENNSAIGSKHNRIEDKIDKIDNIDVNDGVKNVVDNVITNSNAKINPALFILEKNLTDENRSENNYTDELDVRYKNKHITLNEAQKLETDAGQGFLETRDNIVVEEKLSLNLPTHELSTQTVTREGTNKYRAPSPILTTTALTNNVRLKKKIQMNGFSLYVFEKFEKKANKLFKTNQEYYDDLDQNGELVEHDNENNNIYNLKKLEICSNIHENEKNHNNYLNKEIVSNDNSIKSLAKTKNIFQDFNEAGIIPEDVEFKGFKTASNKNIEISVNSFAKTKTLFRDIEEEDTLRIIDEISRENPKHQGPITADNKDKVISENAPKKYLFESIKEVHNSKVIPKSDIVHRETIAKTTNSYLDQLPLSQKFGGFSSASNKKISVSKEALIKTKNFFKDIEDLHGDNLDNKHSEIMAFKGFTTASNKNINISKKALAITKTIFNDIEVDLHFNDALQKEISNVQEVIPGKIVTTPNRTTRTRNVFQDDAEIFPISQKNYGFSTASNKNTTVSKEFQEPVSFAEQKELIIGESTKFKGFTTASNKNIKISETSLAQAKNKFQDIDEVETSKEIPKFQGFTTASNQNIPVSKEALQKTKGLFKDDADLFPISQKLGGFSSAINKNNTIELSEQERIAQNLKEDLLINTQIQKHFEDTEDFHITQNLAPKRTKAPGSPILSCPNAKRRKTNIFKVPYSQVKLQKKFEVEADSIIEEKHADNKIIYKFDDNYKKGNRIPIKNIKKHIEHHTSIKIDQNFDDLMNFEFRNERNDLLGSKLSIEDLKALFLNSVDKKIIPDGWLDNHIKLILWKLLSYEIFFPASISIVATAKNVLEQLKYRYDRELYKVERPALRKILEKDETPGRSMVLCVVRIITEQQENQSGGNATGVELDVSDGWYCVRASIDKRLCKAVADGKIVVGCKLATHGAELVNCEQGKAPWEDTSLVRLKLSGNSTRRAPWHARLGFHGNAATMMVSLSSVTPDGGRVARLHVFVARVYPMLFVEKFADGSTVTRSERLENIYSAAHETVRQAKLERVYEQVERELSDEDTQESQDDMEHGAAGGAERGAAESGEQIAKMMRRCRDPHEFAVNLTESQVNRVNEYSLKKRDKILENIQRKVQEKMDKTGLNQMERKVVPLLKIRIVSWQENRRKHPKRSENCTIVDRTNVTMTDAINRSSDGGGAAVEVNAATMAGNTNVEHLEITKGWLSIWKPSEHLLDIINEGIWLDCMNVVATSVRMSELHLSAGRQSMFNKSRQQNVDKIDTHIKGVLRKCTKISDLHQDIIFNEVDTVGLIFEIEPNTIDFEKQPTRNQNFQNVYLTDSEKNFVCVNFWGGLKKFGYEKLLNVGQFVSCSNLQKRMGNSRKHRQQFRATEFSIFTKTPKNCNTGDELKELKANFQSVDLNVFCLECKNLKDVTANNKNIENISPYRFNNSDYNISKNKMFIDSIHPQNKDDFNLAGLDFDSTFKQESQTDEQLKRKAIIKSKMEKLKMYGEPPPLSPMHIIDRSLSVRNSFQSPILGRNDSSSSSLCVASAGKSRDNKNVAKVKINCTENNVIEDKSDDTLGRNDSYFAGKRRDNQNVARVKINSTENNEDDILERNDSITDAEKARDYQNVGNLKINSFICDGKNLATPPIVKNKKNKRSFVNPVKLDFSSGNVARSQNGKDVASEKVCVKDGSGFEEEFDCSPPLSLDTVMF